MHTELLYLPFRIQFREQLLATYRISEIIIIYMEITTIIFLQHARNLISTLGNNRYYFKNFFVNKVIPERSLFYEKKTHISLITTALFCGKHITLERGNELVPRNDVTPG